MGKLQLLKVTEDQIQIQLKNGAIMYIDSSMYDETYHESVAIYQDDDLYNDAEITIDINADRITPKEVDYPNMWHEELEQIKADHEKWKKEN